MKNILIVTDLFLNGGLETHILTYVEELEKEGFKVFLATKSRRQEYLSYGCFEKVYFFDEYDNYDSSVLDKNIKKITTIIKNDAIDILHAHPFFALIESFFAAQECQIPYIITLHGPLSLGRYVGAVYELFLRTVLLEYAEVIVVSDEIKEMFASYKNDIRVMPNPIDISKYMEVGTVQKQTDTHKCAIISRLDEDKLIGIYDFFDKVKATDCKTIEVFGNGNHESSFERKIKQLSSSIDIRKKGFSNNIAKELTNHYCCVIGMGRVVLEAAFMNMPVILIGYDGVKGIVDKKLLEKASYANFSGRGLQTITEEELHEEYQQLLKEPQKFKLRDYVTEHYSSKNIVQNYISLLSNIKFNKCSFYNELKKLFLNIEFEQTENLYKSQIVFDKLMGLLERYTLLAQNILVYKLHQSNEQVIEKEQQLLEKSHQLQQTEQELQQKEQELHEAKETIDSLSHQLNTIYSSNIWKFAQKYYAIKESSMLSPVMKVGRSLKKHGIKTTFVKLYARSVEQVNKRKNDEANREQLEKILEKYPNETIIVLPDLVDWNIPLFQRPQHLAKNLAKQGFLYFYCTANTQYDKVDGFEEFSDRCIITNRFDLLDSIAGRKKVYDLSSTDNKTDWNFVVDRLMQGNIILYQYIDEISAEISGHAIPEKLYKKHINILKDERCIVIPSATKLENDVKKYRSKNFKLVTNGVEIEHFAQKIDIQSYPEEIKAVVNRNKPVIGYFGAFASWFDYELVLRLAIEREDLEIVLLGVDYDGSIKKYQLEKYDNITVLGPIPYTDLPRYAACFDVSTIPFVINDITESTSPIKLFEYMAMGRPIVKTDMPECRKYTSVLIGKNHDEFIAQIEKALSLREDKSYLSILEKEAYENSWESKAKDIAEMLEKYSR